jgi:glycosyltransferase involved in cell wall biosynthesis
MKLSLIIPAHNEEALLAACLQCAVAELQANRERGPFEIIVVDNASTDRTAEVAAAVAQARVVAEPIKGLTHARQRGLEEARGAILAYVDADTRMPHGWLARVLDAYERDEHLVCISGPYVYHDLPRVKQVLVRVYWQLLARPMYWLTRYMAVGGNFAAKKQALLGIGGFDTTISFYGEDTNIARRLSRSGTVLFDMRLVMPTSARRLHGEGFVRTALRYAINFLSEVLLKRPATTRYRDIR